VADVGCTDGDYGTYDARGIAGAPGQSIVRISEAGWEADWAPAMAAGRAEPGRWRQPRGRARCVRRGVQGGRQGRIGRGRRLQWPRRQGGENGYPSIALLALHARVTVRNSEIEMSDGG
jgi:hypothetical protein